MTQFDVHVIEETIQSDISEETIKIEFKAENVNISNDPGLIFEAGQSIGGHKMVFLKENKLYLADKDNPDCFNRVIGMSRNAGGEGDDITVKLDSVLRLDGWGLIPDKLYYLGSAGQITETAPTSGIFQIVGYGKSANEFFVNLKNPILRS